MKYLFSIVSLVLSTCLVSCGDSVTSPEEEGVEFVGQVVLERDCMRLANFSGVTVELLGTGLKAETDSTGTFRFRSVRPGEYFIRGTKPGYWERTANIIVYPHTPYENSIGLILFGKTSQEPKFEGDWTMTPTMTTIYPDSFYVNEWGETIRTYSTRIVEDTLVSANIRVWLKGEDVTASNQVRAVFSKIRDFEYHDQVSYGNSPNSLGAEISSQPAFSLVRMREAGLRQGDTIFTRAWAYNQCSSGQQRIGATSDVKAFGMP